MASLNAAEFLTVEETARKKLNVHPQTLYRWMHKYHLSGKQGAFRMGRIWRIDWLKFRQALESHHLHNLALGLFAARLLIGLTITPQHKAICCHAGLGSHYLIGGQNIDG